MRISKSTVDRLPIPPKVGRGSQKRYYDNALKGFGVRVTSGGTKAFFVEKLVNRKLRRITLGRYPELTVEMARKQAQITLGKIATGIDPIAEKQAQHYKGITLAQAFEDYLQARKSLKASTALDYRRGLNQVLSDWMDKPLTSITKEMIVKRHTEHGQERSQARANLAMRVLRAIFNFAINEYEDAKGKPVISNNPVKRLSHARSWYRIQRRHSVIKRHDLANWYDGLMQYTHPYHEERTSMMQDYFLLVLLTGLRRQEAASLCWQNIDLKDRTLTIEQTKNHQRHVLPLSDYLYELMLRRQPFSQQHHSDYLFPAESETGHLKDPRKAMLKIAELSGVPFTIHDLRRTFITIAESLDIPAYALKRLLNHATTNDVTADYIIIDVERLRRPMQKITDHILTLMRIDKKA